MKKYFSDQNRTYLGTFHKVYAVGYIDLHLSIALYPFYFCHYA